MFKLRGWFLVVVRFSKCLTLQQYSLNRKKAIIKHEELNESCHIMVFMIFTREKSSGPRRREAFLKSSGERETFGLCIKIATSSDSDPESKLWLWAILRLITDLICSSSLKLFSDFFTFGKKVSVGFERTYTTQPLQISQRHDLNRKIQNFQSFQVSAENSWCFSFNIT